MPRGLIHHTAGFRWAHCYAVRARVLPRLLEYLEENMTAPRARSGTPAFHGGSSPDVKRFRDEVKVGRRFREIRDDREQPIGIGSIDNEATAAWPTSAP